MDDWRHGGFGIYIHWPFCQAKCPYCDFNSHVSAQVDHDLWRKTLVEDIRFQSQGLEERTLDSIFFGGGTPSLMEPATVDACITEIAKTFNLAENVEISLEANPTSVEAEKFKGFAAAGVNRVSIGVQALNDKDLRRLGRLHSAQEARGAINLARETFERMSFDLIYARQNQTIDAWQEELATAINLAADHLSLYQLTIEDGTAFGALQAAGRLRGLPDDDLSSDMYLATQEMCNEAGLTGYEVSNHAKPGMESRHNLIYWRYGDYLGIGPGAHGRISKDGARLATEAVLMPTEWLRATRAAATKATEVLSPEAQFTEMMLMGLRLAEGVSETRILEVNPGFDFARLYNLIDENLILRSEGRLTVQNENKIVLNQILKEILW